MVQQPIAPLQLGEECEDCEHQSEQYYGEPVDVLFFLIIALLLGVFTCTFLKVVPYTGWMTIWGIVIGIATQTGADWPYITYAVRRWVSISGELLLAVFLPPIVYQSASLSDWHVIERQLFKVLWLAFVGTIVGTALTALALRYLLPWGWRWSECVLVGAILAPTDPVAVVALMSSAGTSAELTSVVEGESLFNDGVAFALFQVVLAWAEGEDTSVRAVTTFLVKAAGGGVGMGLVFGVGLTAGYLPLHDDFLAETAFTLATVYACFLVSDVLLGVSGLLAVVVMGVFMAAYGRYYISRRVGPPAAAVWSLADFTGNTVLFALSGLFISRNMLNGDGLIGNSEWGWVFIIWLLLLAVRAVLLLASLPILRYTGYPMSLRDVGVLFWSGLRGAVALALALSVTNSASPQLSAEFRAQVEFFTTFIVLLTLFLQGATMPLLLAALGYREPDPVETHFMREAVQEMDAIDGRGALQVDQELTGQPDWRVVDAWSRVHVDEVVHRKVAGPAIPLVPCWSRMQRRHLQIAHAALQEQQLVHDARKRYLHALKAAYTGLVQDGLVQQRDEYELQYSVDVALDRLEQPISTFPTFARHQLMGNTRERIVRLLPNRTASRLRHWMQRHQALRSLALLIGSQEANAHVREYCRECETAVQEHLDEVGEASQHNGERGRGGDVGQQGKAACGADDTCEWRQLLHTQQEAAKQVLAEAEEDANAARLYIAQLRDERPADVRQLLTRVTVMQVMNQKAQFLERLCKHGLLEEEDEHYLQKLLQHREMLYKLRVPVAARLWEPKTRTERAREHALFVGLPHKVFVEQVLPRGHFAVMQRGAQLGPEGHPKANLPLVCVVLQGAASVAVGRGAASCDTSPERGSLELDGNSGPSPAPSAAGGSSTGTGGVQWHSSDARRHGRSSAAAGPGGTATPNARSASHYFGRYSAGPEARRGRQPGGSGSTSPRQRGRERRGRTGEHDVGEGGFWSLADTEWRATAVAQPTVVLTLPEEVVAPLLERYQLHDALRLLSLGVVLSAPIVCTAGNETEQLVERAEGRPPQLELVVHGGD